MLAQKQNSVDTCKKLHIYSVRMYSIDQKGGVKTFTGIMV